MTTRNYPDAVYRTAQAVHDSFGGRVTIEIGPYVCRECRMPLLSVYPHDSGPFTRTTHEPGCPQLAAEVERYAEGGADQ